MAKVALICGAAGFIGSYTIRAFNDAGWNVLGAGRGSPSTYACSLSDVPYLQGDLREQSFVDAVLAAARPDQIVFAAGPSNVQSSFDDPTRDFESQVLPLFRMLEAARRLPRLPRVMLVSSAAVYGNPSHMPTAETSQLAPISPYGYHKLHQERLLDEFTALYGLPTCKARVFSTYGIGLRHLAVWDITRRVMSGESSLRGRGRESRDYLNVRDVASALEMIASGSNFAGEAVNVASGDEVTIERLARAINRELGEVAGPRFDGEVLAGSPIRWQADVGVLRALGFVQQVPFALGIAETVDWIKHSA